MNNFQREQIWLLRKNGLGYGEVAQVIGLSKDSVKKYCKRHPELKGQGTLPYLMVEKRVQDGTNCPQCFQPMVPNKTGRPKKFCSDRCRINWWKNHQEEHDKEQTAYEEMTCHCCGRSFLSYANPNRKYCSHACYIQIRFYKGV